MEFSIGDLFDNQYEVETPVRTMGKAEIEEAVRRFIQINLDTTDLATLYVYLKQMEFAVKTGIEHLKEQAFDSLGQQLGGLSSGKFLGHDVVISYPGEWNYSPAVDSLKERHKKELGGLQEQERQMGMARRVHGKGRITVTLRER